MKKTLSIYVPGVRSVNVVEVLLQCEDYAGTFLYEIEGDVSGFNSIENAPEILRNTWWIRHENGEQIENVEVYEEFEVVTLTNDKGGQLEIEIWDDYDLAELVTSVRIVEVKSGP